MSVKMHHTGPSAISLTYPEHSEAGSLLCLSTHTNHSKGEHSVTQWLKTMNDEGPVREVHDWHSLNLY